MLGHLPPPLSNPWLVQICTYPSQKRTLLRHWLDLVWSRGQLPGIFANLTCLCQLMSYLSFTAAESRYVPVSLTTLSSRAASGSFSDMFWLFFLIIYSYVGTSLPCKTDSGMVWQFLNKELPACTLLKFMSLSIISVILYKAVSSDSHSSQPEEDLA